MPKPAACASCPLYRIGEGWVPPSGPSPVPILLVGEAPGEWEAAKGIPFVGQSGKLLDRLIHRAGADRASFRVANTLCCRPPHNYLAGAPYEQEATNCCAPYLDDEIARCQPKVIVALGLTAFRRLTGLGGLAEHRGFPIKHHVSGAWVVPTYHPAHLLPGRAHAAADENPQRLTGLAILDLRRALEIAERGFALEQAPEFYTLDPTPDEALRWATRFEADAFAGTVRYLAWDIETPGKLRAVDEDLVLPDTEGPLASQITRIGFCYRRGQALSIPWQPEYFPAIHKILSYPVPHATWNGYGFDIPIIRQHSVPLPDRHIHDGMWAWHLLQSDLPRGLQTAASVYCPEMGPWKHLAEAEPARYNAQDADITLRVMEGLEGDLRARGAWDLYQRHIVDLWPILSEAGQVHGVHIDPTALAALAKDLTARKRDLLREAQVVVPVHLHNRKIWKKRPPKDATVVAIPAVESIKACAICGAAPINNRHTGSKRCPTGYPVTRQVPTTQYLWRPEWPTIPDDQLEDVVGAAGFNPGSTQQLIAYAKAHGHEVGENWKTGNEQLDARVRSRLIKKHGTTHPIYALTSEYADVSKALTTYVQGYQPDLSGRIYTTYTFSPSTGRLSSRNVNLQNVAHGKYAGAVRAAILPPPGHVFVEADSAAIEAVFTGHFIDDLEYIRLAKTGIHDYITCLELNRPFDPEALPSYKADPVYRRARERNKRVVHGTNYGMTPKMMVMQYPDAFASEKQALLAQARYFEACPALPKWQHEIRLQAHRQTYLQNPWGYRHYFYAVFEKNAKGEVVPGSDAKRCVAFLPQSSAAAFMRDSLLLLGESPWRAYTPAIVSIHDSICLAVPEAEVPSAVDWLVTTLTRPIPLMADLRVGCAVKVGPTWGSMTLVRTEEAR